MLGGKNAEMFGLMFEILVQLDGGKKSRRELSEGLGVGPQVIGRQIKLLRDVFKVTIKSSPANGYELDGLQLLLAERFKRRFINYKTFHYKVNLIRYADDFIITGRDKELLENEVKPIVIEFLKERGLTLSEEKTTITNIYDGFDFLGFNVRKFGTTG